MKWLSYALFALLFAACGVAGLPDLADESQGRCGDSTIATYLGFGAVVFATINVVGGFLVTHRMLLMFNAKKRKG